MDNAAGYLTYLSRQGCGGCSTFTSRFRDPLIKILPGGVIFVQVDQPSKLSMSSPVLGYENLFNNRPKIEFPMLAWSASHPSVASDFSYYSGNMGDLKSVLQWVDTQLPVPTQSYASAPSQYTPTSSQSQYVPTPSVQTYAPNTGGSVFFNKYY
jgi:hypothetical protein